MSASDQATIVNLGASHVSVSRFSAGAGRLTLEQLLVQDLPVGLNAEDEWLAAAVEALRALVQQHGLSGTATVIVPGFLLLSKPLKVPQVEKARQAQIIAFEAQNAIPYPLAEVVWGSQVLSSDGVESEVLLFALRSDISGRIARLVTDAGLRPTVIQASPLLDGLAWRLASGDAAEEVLVVNVGSRTTNLTFLGSQGMSVQTATLGGNTITQAVSDNTGNAFANAEALKVGFFSGVLQLAESDPQAAVLVANAQAFSKRLAQDINRRLIGLRRGTQGRQLARVLLTGRTAQLPGLREQLAETLRVPVETLDPLATVALGASVNPEYVEAYRPQLSEPIGEAARLVLPDPAGVNLIPPVIATQLAFDARKPLLLGAAALLALSPLPLWWGLHAGAAKAAGLVASVKGREAELAARRAELADIRAKSAAIAAVNAQLEGVVQNRANWNDFLAELQGQVLANRHVWVEELRLTRLAPPPRVAPEGEPAPPPAAPVVRVTLVMRLLLPEVGPAKDAVINSEAFRRRQRELVDSLRKNSFVERLADGDIRADTSQPNLPKLTLTFTVKSDRPL
jgi:type IV pilus assembly protein PilM